MTRDERERIRFFFETGDDCKKIAAKTGIKVDTVRTTVSTMYGASTVPEARKKMMTDNYLRLKALEKEKR